MARAAGENPPAMGYIGCPGLHTHKDTLTLHVQVKAVVYLYLQYVWFTHSHPRECGI